MKVTVKRKEPNMPIAVNIHTEFIKLESALKLTNAFSGGTAKSIIQDGQVLVDGAVCTMRGKKLYPGDRFSFMGSEYMICSYESQ